VTQVLIIFTVDIEFTMRTISFVERLELEFYDEVCDNQQQQALPWNLCQQAIALGDADNDDVSLTISLVLSISDLIIHLDHY